jgi:hypothetical protein
VPVLLPWRGSLDNDLNAPLQDARPAGLIDTLNRVRQILASPHDPDRGKRAEQKLQSLDADGGWAQLWQIGTRATASAAARIGEIHDLA